jgi:hypothetical protein
MNDADRRGLEGGRRRPGRALAAERRRVARHDIARFSMTDGWLELPARVRVAIEALVPEIRKGRR